MPNNLTKIQETVLPVWQKIFRFKYFWLVLVLLLSTFFRLYELGYSHFYGDEIKTLYTDKTVSALNYLLDQRKGPLQFLISWVFEKLSGGFSEYWIRFPFAIIGIASTGVFYLLVQRLFGSRKVSLFSSLLFTLNGFYIAFGRTAQYQVIYILFGLTSFYLLVRGLKSAKYKLHFLVLSGFTMGLAFLAHYDAVFFLVPMAVYYLSFSKYKPDYLKIGLFLTPLLIVAGIFYAPYIYTGHFAENTVGYLSKRVTGKDYIQNDSLYTISVYNPLLVFYLLVAFCLIAIKKNNPQNLYLVIWFVLPFLLFQLVFKNPGTHIHNYLLPLLILAGIGYRDFSNKYGDKADLLAAVLFSVYLVIQLFVFIPAFNNGYPYKNSKFVGVIDLPKVDKSKQLFLYGFPYYRSWEKIGAKLSSYNRVQGFYSNDNTDVAYYYLQKYPVTEPGNNFLPQYYIEIPDSQEFRSSEPDFIKNYVLREVVVITPSSFAKIYYRY